MSKQQPEEELALIEEQRRNLRLKNEKLELEIASQKGELVPVNQVTREWTKMALAMKNKMLAIPSAIAPELADLTDAAECEALLREQVEEALKELSQGKD